MKTTDPRDTLDRKIDECLASLPAKAPTNFTAHTLAGLDKQTEDQRPRPLAPLIRFALPLAAAVALAFVIFSQSRQDELDQVLQATRLTKADAAISPELTDYEIHEILLLQEGLVGFAQIESEELNSSDLLDTLETLYSI